MTSFLSVKHRHISVRKGAGLTRNTHLSTWRDGGNLRPFWTPQIKRDRFRLFPRLDDEPFSRYFSSIRVLKIAQKRPKMPWRAFL